MDNQMRDEHRGGNLLPMLIFIFGLLLLLGAGAGIYLRHIQGEMLQMAEGNLATIELTPGASDTPREGVEVEGGVVGLIRGIVMDQVAPMERAYKDLYAVLPPAPEGWTREDIDDADRQEAVRHELEYHQGVALMRHISGEAREVEPYKAPDKLSFGASPNAAKTEYQMTLYKGPEGQQVVFAFSQLAPTRLGLVEAMVSGAGSFGMEQTIGGHAFLTLAMHADGAYTDAELPVTDIDRLTLKANVPADAIEDLVAAADLAALGSGPEGALIPQ